MRYEEILRHRRRSRRLAAALAVALASGCVGEEGPLRLPVTGRVTLDGTPLPSGTVTFHPGGKGPAASAGISEGSFAIGRSEGLAPGTYKVEIVSVQETGKRVTSPDDPTATIDEVRNLIPVRYNRESRIQAEVKPAGENSYQFDLSSREEGPRGRRVAGARANERRSFN
ncbi:MAG: hypothetical protein U0790_21300 [Isosphaeraceae bacterium]